MEKSEIMATMNSVADGLSRVKKTIVDFGMASQAHSSVVGSINQSLNRMDEAYFWLNSACNIALHVSDEALLAKLGTKAGEAQSTTEA